MSYYVVIRGPLGVGKSTVSERLAEEIGAEHILIDRILEEHGLEEWDEDRISLKSFLRANALAIERARRLLEKGTPVVFDGNFYWRPALDDLLQKLNYRHYVLTLEAPLSVCVQRDRLRPMTREGAEPRAGDSLGEEATAQVYRMVNQVSYGIAIDATGSVDATVAAVLSHITSARTPGSS
jgi:adenylate kinase family enzyme